MNRRPVVALSLLWTAGYALAYSYHWTWLSIYTALLSAMVLIILWLLNVPGRTGLCSLLVLLISAGYFSEYDSNNQTKLALAATAAVGIEDTGAAFEGVITTGVEVDGDKAAFIFRSDRDGGELFVVNVKLLTKDEQDIALTWKRADRLRLNGVVKKPETARNFEGFDYRRYLRLQHIHWQLSVKGASQADLLPADPWTLLTLLRWNDQFRERLGDGIEAIFPMEQSGFMKSMLIGVTDDIAPSQFQQFSQLGLTHILAVSGLNVAIFLACLLWLMRKFGFTRETYLITAMAIMPFYIAVTGASPSIVRAGLMAIIALYAAYRHILKDGLHTVLLVGFGMLIWEPYYLLDVSFQLSFLVTIGLILGVPAVNKLLPIRSETGRNALSITLVAQCVSFPVSIYYFNQFSILSLAANLLLVPVFSLVTMPAGSAALIVGLIYIPAGKAMAWMLAKLNGWIFMLVETSSGWDLFQTIWPSPGIGWIVVYYGALTAIVCKLLKLQEKKQSADRPMLTFQKKSSPFVRRIRSTADYMWLPSSILLVLLLLGFGYYARDSWDHQGKVDFIDVGQGDSILIRTPQSGSVILVDGGGTLTFHKPGDEWKKRKDPYEVGRKMLVPLLKKRGIHQIDYLIVTHQDADHIGGLQAVLEQIPVKRLVFNGTLKPTPGVEKLFKTALDKRVRLIKAYSGDKLVADTETSLYVLNPQTHDDTAPLRLEKAQNEQSIVFLMEMSGTGWLFTGDIGQESEKRILITMTKPEQQKKSLDVMKIPHHGSKTSSSAPWLDTWKPRIAVISVGAQNTYGHPNPQVLNRLEERGMEILRTDMHGEVQMRIHDGGITLRTKLE